MVNTQNRCAVQTACCRKWFSKPPTANIISGQQILNKSDCICSRVQHKLQSSTNITTSLHAEHCIVHTFPLQVCDEYNMLGHTAKFALTAHCSF